MLSPADLARYRRDGFIVLPDILTRDEVAALRRVTDRRFFETAADRQRDHRAGLAAAE